MITKNISNSCLATQQNQISIFPDRNYFRIRTIVYRFLCAHLMQIQLHYSHAFSRLGAEGARIAVNSAAALSALSS